MINNEVIRFKKNKLFLAVLDLLVRHGADPFARNRFGRTAWETLEQSLEAEIVKKIATDCVGSEMLPRE